MDDIYNWKLKKLGQQANLGELPMAGRWDLDGGGYYLWNKINGAAEKERSTEPKREHC